MSRCGSAPVARRSFQAAAAAAVAATAPGQPASTSSAYSHLNPPGTKVSNASHLVHQAAVNGATLDDVALPEKLSSLEKVFMRSRSSAGDFQWRSSRKMKARKKAFELNDTLKVSFPMFLLKCMTKKGY